MIVVRTFCMPSRWTFEMKPVAALLDRWVPTEGIIVDPFAGRSTRGTLTNDLNPTAPTTHHMDARDFLDTLIDAGVRADCVLLDPPYSPRQISECYKGVGKKASATDTQNARLYKECIVRLDALLVPGGVAIRCGWNSLGFGKGYTMQELLLVTHGGAHNDTIVTVETKGQDASGGRTRA